MSLADPPAPPRDVTAQRPAAEPARPAPVSLGETLGELSKVLTNRPDDDRVTLRELFAALDRATYPALVLVFALLLVSPLSAVPGATTAFGLSIAAILVQQLAGRRRVWLPALLLDRSLPVGRVRTALDWLQRPVGWLERRLRRRLRWLLAPPIATVPVLVVLAAALCLPLMELIPGSGTSVGAAISVYAAGLLARDGLFVATGATLAGFLPFGLWLLLT